MNSRLSKTQIIQLLILLSSIAVGFLLLNPLRSAADRRAELFKESIIGQIEETLGMSIQYESISPALLSIVTVRGLKVSFDQGDFSAERVRVFYNPLRRFLGKDGSSVSMISRIAVYRSSLNLNLETDRTDPESVPEKTFNPWPLLSDKSVDITDFSAHITINESTDIRAENVSLQMKENGNTVRYNFSGDLNAAGIKGLDKFGEIDASLSSIGQFDPGGSRINGRLDLLSVSSSLVVFEPMSIDVTFSDNELTARRVDDSRPLDLAFKLTKEGWSIDGKAVELSLREIAHPGSESGSWDPWFSSVIDGDFSYTSSRLSKDFHYNTDLRIFMQAGILSWDLEAALKLRGTDIRAEIEDITLTSSWGNVSYSGSFGIPNLAPNGKFSFNLDEKILGYPVSAVFNLATENGAVTAEPVLFEAADLDFEDFRFLIVREQNLYTLSMLIVPGREDDNTVRRLTIDGFIDASSSLVFHGFTSVIGLKTSYIARLLGVKDSDNLPIVKDSLFNMQGYFEANSTSWVLSVDDAEIRDRNNSKNFVSLKGRASPGSVSLDSLRISWNDYIVDGRAYGSSSQDGGTAEGRLIIDEQIYPLTAKWFQDGRVQLDSKFGLNAVLGRRSATGRSLQLVSNKVALPLHEGTLIVDVDLRGRVARNDWELFLNKSIFQFTDRKRQPDVSVSLNGSLNPGRIVLPDILIQDDKGKLSGSASFNSVSDGKELKGRLHMGSETGESYELSLLKSDDFWDVGVNINAARIERFMKDRMEGLLSVNGRMTGTLEDPIINLNINTDKGILDRQPFEARAAVTMESGRIRVQDLYYQYEGMSLSRGLFLINLSNGTVRSTAELNATFNQVPVSSGFSLGVDFGRGFTLLELSEIPKMSFTGTLATRSVLWDSRQHLPPFTFQFIKTDDSFSVRTPDGKTLDAKYVFNTGNLQVLSDSPMPVSIRGGGTIKDGELNLSFPEISIDPVLINYVMFRDPILLQYHVVFQSGRLTGNLDITGPAANPLINGEMLADKLLVDTPYTYADIKPASTKIHFRDHRVDVDKIQIPIGDGIVYASGYIELDRLKLVDFDMTYGGKGTLKGGGVPVYYPLMGINLDGEFTGEVHMTGGNKHFLLTGDITFPYLKASLGAATIPVIQVRKGVYPSTVDLDFNFITGNNCTFFLPNEQLKIVKASAESGQVINMKYSNNPKSLLIKGLLPVKSGDIYYFDRDFQITDGSILFDETLNSFNPQLNLRAETKVRDDKGEEVTVALVYNSPVKSDFTPKIETNPPKSDLEVMALFGQAVAPYSNSDEQDAASTVLLATGGMFGQVGIVQPFEDVLREGLNLDMVTIRTDIIENTLAEGLARGNSPRGDNRTGGLGRYLDNTSLYAGKYIGDALFISGTVSANYFEGQRLRSVFGGLEFETSVSLEMETPFFNVAWSYSPDPTRNQNFVADNEISLKWQFSY